ncbi:hypothetical protein [Spongiactinospora sp. TRM90649]|uniref:hypothetical protein n=1 Tax=Spongiactinospora sp. TRM90649 TaxID=3031114 RepID=UPI0023F84682|nr:hypothetical protein [Spongiactinospora sp. TRM90649]MDF5756654.1 hypothetical protein [Spongiactinospora sp. TRM90649]
MNATKWVYRNGRTGQTIELDERSVRFDHLDNWLLIASPPQPEGAPPVQVATKPLRPADNASKPQWVTYAIARGIAEADALSLSKPALIEECNNIDAEDGDGAH